MKSPLPTVAALVLASTTIHAEMSYPPRKAGLWEMTMQADAKAGSKVSPHVTQQCIDAKTDQALREMGQGMNKDACSKQDMRKDGDKIVVDSVCKFGASTATTHSVITGDFSSSYRMETHSTYSPPMAGRSEGNAVIETKWIGPCKADQKPGDMMMPGGMKMNIMDMMASQPQMKKK